MRCRFREILSIHKDKLDDEEKDILRCENILKNFKVESKIFDRNIGHNLSKFVDQILDRIDDTNEDREDPLIGMFEKRDRTYLNKIFEEFREDPKLQSQFKNAMESLEKFMDDNYHSYQRCSKFDTQP